MDTKHLKYPLQLSSNFNGLKINKSADFQLDVSGLTFLRRSLAKDLSPITCDQVLLSLQQQEQ
jgi:hypothetical protein